MKKNFLVCALSFSVTAQTINSECRVTHETSLVQFANVASYDINLCSENLIQASFKVKNSQLRDTFVDFQIVYANKPNYKNQDTIYFPNDDIESCDQTDGPFLCIMADRPTSSPRQPNLTMRIMAKIKVTHETTSNQLINPELISLWVKYLPAKE